MLVYPAFLYDNRTYIFAFFQLILILLQIKSVYCDVFITVYSIIMQKIILFLFLILIYQAGSQSLSVFDVDTTDFPIMRAKFYATDENWNQITNLSKSDFQIIENGEVRNVINVSCPDHSEIKPISSVLSIDVSGSMQGNKIEIAKEAASAWIKALPEGKSECAVTSFNTKNQYLQDFTSDKVLLLNKLDNLGADGGTDFDAAFINPLAGGLLALEKAKYKKILVLITDGMAIGNENKIITKAQSLGATIYCVTLGFNCPDILKNISEQTGGKWFENVTTIQEAKEVYNNILQIEQGNYACTLEWESNYQCFSQNIKVTIDIQSLNLQDICYYNTPDKSIRRITISPSAIFFKNKTIGVQADTTITVTAELGDFTVTDFICKNPLFSITPKSFTLAEGESKDLTLSFTPVDSNFSYAPFDIETDFCNFRFYSTAGYIDYKNSSPTLRLIHPNGGEIFLAGSDTLITWEGILPSDTVELSYTYNDGASWNVITKNANGLSYNWQNIPTPESSECRVKVSKINNNVPQKDTMRLQHLLAGHDGSINDMNWSPDGTKIATASTDRTVAIWNTFTGKRLLVLSGYLSSVRHVSWSPDGTKIVTNSNESTKMWDIASGQLLFTLNGHYADINYVCFNNSGTKFATCSSDKTCKIWDAESGLLILSLEDQNGFLAHLSWSPDDLKLATMSSNCSTKIWEVNTGNLLLTLQGQKEGVNSYGFTCSWSPDGSKLAASDNDSTSKIWDTSNGNLLYTLNGHDGLIYYTKWSPDGQKLATASRDNTAAIWDANSGKLLQSLKYHSYAVSHISWSPDGSRVATASYDKTAAIWDADSGQLLLALDKHESNINKIRWSPDGYRLATAGSDHRAIIWDAQSGQLIYSLEGPNGDITSWSPDGNMIATTGLNFRSLIWDANIGSIRTILEGHKGIISYISWSPGGSKVATASYDSTGRIWNAETGEQLKTLKHISSKVSQICWSPDGSRVATVSDDHTATIWDVSTGTLLHTLNVHKRDVNIVSWSPDGSRVATASDDKTAAIWDVNSGSLLYLLTKHTDVVNHLAWSHDGSKIATASSDKTAVIWDANTGINLLELKSHLGSVNHLGWSPDDSKVATASSDKYVILWDANLGTILNILNDLDFPINYLSWNPDGNMIATSSFTGPITIFNTATGKVLYSIENNEGYIYSVEWSPDGSRIAYGNSKSKARIWLLDDGGTFDQFDTSDSLFSIVIPKIESQDIDMGKVVINTRKDSVVNKFIANNGKWQCRIDSIYFTGSDDQYFALNGPLPKYTVLQDEDQWAEFKFAPTEVREYKARIVIVSQADTIFQNIRGEGVEPKVLVVNEDIDFGRVYIGDTRDTLDAVTITNVGNFPVNISKTEHAFPNATDFTTIKGAGPFTLNPGDTCRMDLAYTANSIGRTSGLLLFYHDASGSPHQVALHAEGYARNTVDIEDIVFADQPVGTANDSTVSEYFHNSGLYENKVENVFLAKGDFDQFEIKNLSVPFYLSKDEQLDLDITFKPTSTGNKQTNLYMVCQSDTIIRNVIGRSTSEGMEIITDNIDYGTIELGQRVDSTNIPILVNTGTEDLILSQVTIQGTDVIDFETGMGFVSTTLAEGDTLFVDLDFYPQTVGTKDSYIEILHHLSANPAIVNVFGEAIEAQTPTISISIPDLEARAGETINLPIILVDTLNLHKLVSDGMAAKIEFNSYVMLPTNELAEIHLNQGHITFNEFDVNKNIGDTLAMMPFSIMLGDKEVSPILFSEITAKDKMLLINTKPGSLKLIDLCEEGGKRFFNPDGIVGISNLSPNPAENRIQIDFSVIEAGYTEITLVNMLGKTVATFFAEDISDFQDRQIIQDISEIGSGQYILQFKTPTYVERRKVMVVR